VKLRAMSVCGDKMIINAESAIAMVCNWCNRLTISSHLRRFSKDSTAET
jgi:hypothetical protein